MSETSVVVATLMAIDEINQEGAANTIIRDIVTALRGEIVGEVYISFGSSVVEEAVARILGDLYVTLDGNWAYTAGKRLNEN